MGERMSLAEVLSEMRKEEKKEFRKFKVFCNRCKETVNVIAKDEQEIRLYWACQCGSANFQILGEG